MLEYANILNNHEKNKTADKKLFQRKSFKIYRKNICKQVWIKIYIDNTILY